jgi:hypothetical protein
MRKPTLVISAAVVLAITLGATGNDHTAEVGKVSLLHVPHDGIQPQAVVDENGILHLVYFRGDPRHGDLFYVRSRDAVSFSDPIPVNGRADSAIAIGNIRGAHLAIGRGGRVHVCWMGSDRAGPKAPGGAQPMLYTRLKDDGTTFEEERNLIRSAVGLDGGGSLAADREGNVYVAWHAPPPGERGEENRRVWLARSADDGQTFAAEIAASPLGSGACGCCGMRAFCDHKGSVYLLYRSAGRRVDRDTHLLVSEDRGTTFRSDLLEPWKINACPMSSFALAEGGDRTVAAWETNGQVSFAQEDPVSGHRGRPVVAPGSGGNRKHPAVAVNARGETILAWTEGMGWNRGGKVAWQVFDRSGRPASEMGKADGVPTWSLVTVVAKKNGGFAIVY